MKTVRGIEFIYDKIRELEEEICSNETQIDLFMKTVREIEFIYYKIRELEEEICSNEIQIDLLLAHIAELTNDSEEISRTLDDLRSVL